MRFTDFYKKTQIDEIARLHPSMFTGGKNELANSYYDYNDARGLIKTEKLPGGSGLLYSIQQRHAGNFTIRIWDPLKKNEFKKEIVKPVKFNQMDDRTHQWRLDSWNDRKSFLDAKFLNAPGKLVAQLVTYPVYEFLLEKAVKVEYITVDEGYRGIGLAKALYGIVLSILKLPLVAGSSQTPGGRRNWVSLASIPGVEVKGYFTLTGNELESSYIIDTIMGKLGGQYIGQSGDDYYFTFDIRPNTEGKEIEAYVKTNLSKLYSREDWDNSIGLFAIWKGK